MYIYSYPTTAYTGNVESRTIFIPRLAGENSIDEEIEDTEENAFLVYPNPAIKGG